MSSTTSIPAPSLSDLSIQSILQVLASAQSVPASTASPVPSVSTAAAPAPALSADVPTLKHLPDFTANEYLELARSVVEVNPFGAKHGSKGAKWEEVAKMCKSKGLFKTSWTDVIKNKALALIKYQEDPESTTGSKITWELSSAAGITVATLLNRASENKRLAKSQTEEQREKTAVKDENDRKGGEAIRKKSMTTLGRCSCSCSREVSTELDSDSENQNPKRCYKHRRIVGMRGSSELLEFREMMQKAKERYREFEEKMVKSIEDSTRVYAQS